ncbi:MAG TPA: transcriptional regulator NrdR [Armatimonadota bacterium]
MKCPFCGHLEDKVLDSRSVREGEAVRRRRECLECERRYTTYEQVEATLLMVVKKDGRREPFNRGKLLGSMMVACKKRPIAMEALEQIADDLERTFYGSTSKEVTSQEIGEAIVDRLQGLDQVAFVRFASVYRDFQDINQFKEIVDVMGRELRGARRRRPRRVAG